MSKLNSSWVLACGLLALTLANRATRAEVLVNEDTDWRFFKGLREASTPDIGASLTGTIGGATPTLLEVVPAPGARVSQLTSLEVIFDQKVGGVEARDLLVNGVPATGLNVYSPRDYGFTFAEPPVGAVTIAWASDAGITNAEALADPFSGGTWSYVLDHSPPPADVIISEFLADNEHGLRDNFAVRSDWIEVLNRGSTVASLDGWFLTDQRDQPTKWRFPAVSLAANSYLVIWASGRDLADAGAPLHANFKLENDGEYLALVDPHTNIVSEFAPQYPPQRPDISYGRDRVSPDRMGFFLTPTPGAPNPASGAGFAPEPVFSLPGGVYTNQSLMIALTASAGTIRYTVNGTRPTEASPVYTGPVSVTRSTVIQARVFQTDLLPGAIVVQTYNMIGTGLANFSSNLPLLILNTAGRGIVADSRIPAFVTAIEPFRGRASLEAPAAFQGSGQIEVRGQSSTGFPKLAYNLELDDPAGNDLEVPLLGLPAESDWVLYNPYSDKPFLQNFLAYELHGKMGHYAPRCRFVEVFLENTTGRIDYPKDYVGIYILIEKIKVAAHRVDLARLTPQQNTEPEISGGYIVKKDKDSPGDRNFSTAGGGGFSSQLLKIHEPKPREVTTAQLSWIQNYLKRFERALYATNWLTATGTNHYSYYIDTASLVDNHWIVEFPKQIDGYRLSNFMSKDRGGKLRMEPIWDWNLSFGNADYADGFNTSNWYYRQCDENSHIWLRRLITGTTSATSTTGDPDFNQQIVDRWSVLRTNILDSSNVLARIDQLAAILDEAQKRDFARWPRLGVYVWPNPPLYSTPTNYAGIIASMKNWVQGRYNWIDSQFLKAPQFSHYDSGVSPGFTLSMSAPAGVIYYTMDGTDPRLSGGGLSPRAQPYATAVPLAANTRLLARARNGNRWSGPTAASFTVETPPLIITELMYSPAKTATAKTNDAGRFEFIELKNMGAQPLDLRGFRFTEGIQFSFSTGQVVSLAPGAFVLLARDAAALTSRYGKLTNLAGEYQGSLANEGEPIRLLGPMDEGVYDITYDPSWYPVTDGLGFALVVANENQPRDIWQKRHGWRAGTLPGGTPGFEEPATSPSPPVFVNEVLSYAAPPALKAIELYNPNPNDVDIGSWFLSDDPLTPKYRFPAGTLIRAGDYLLLTEKEFDLAPGLFPSFNLLPSGGAVFLFSAQTDGLLTGYRHGFSFGAALQGVSFGRHLTSTGAELFVAQTSLTLGQTNSEPRVGPVVISEIMYHPPDVFTNNAFWDNSEDEYVELHNLTTVAVPLFDPRSPTNTWRLRDAVKYDFPTNTTLAPGERILVVSFDPAGNSTATAAFRQRYGLTANLRLCGPWAGKLANDKNSVELVQPSVVRLSATNTLLAEILVDKVEYHDAPPWPVAADGMGFSLQRLSEASFGNDPTNWQAASPTPGAPFPYGVEPVISRAPVHQSVLPGATVIFSVEATGGAALLYQWRHDDENIPGAASATLTLTNVQTEHAGRYQVAVWNSSQSVASETVTLQVGQLPLIQTQPKSTNAWPGSAVVFSVIAVGAPPLQYQWQKNGILLPGAVQPALNLPAVEAADEGVYEVLVSDASGTRLSDPSRLAVLGDPFMVQPPLSLTANRGGTATFSVAVTNSSWLPITYEWRKEDTTVGRHTLASLVDFLTISNVQFNDAGKYSVMLTNRASLAPGITSAAAVLQVIEAADTDGDGMPDSYELAHGLNPLDPTDARLDSDHDGASNLAEYFAGTDPQDQNSVLKVEKLETAAGAVTIRFRCLTSRTYTILWRDKVAGSPWNPLAGVPAIASSGTETRIVEVVDPDGFKAGQRYYRLVTPGVSGQ